jgi:hypothetical protein
MGGLLCSNGQCEANCGAGLARCGNVCVDLQDDKNNCGFCAQICAGNLVCTNGACACPSGDVDCNGVCANLLTDNANCGGCGNGCAAGQTCQGGTCK